MDAAHRDRAGLRAGLLRRLRARAWCVTHAPTGQPFATKYAQQVFGRERASHRGAFPGDVVGLVNATSLRVGDSSVRRTPVAFPPIPSFAPEHFAVARAKDSSRYKQFRRGIDQLDHEGVVQVLRSDLRGDQAPVLAAVGPMQFEVAEHRIEHELRAPIHLETLPYTIARRTRREDIAAIEARRGTEVLERGDGVLLALFTDRWRVQIGCSATTPRSCSRASSPRWTSPRPALADDCEGLGVALGVVVEQQESLLRGR